MGSMSRYSRIFLRPTHPSNGSSWTGEFSSKMSTKDPYSSSSSPGYSYPPTAGLSQDSERALTSPPPHPYQLAAFHSPIETSMSREGASIVSHAPRNINTSEFSSEKPPDSAFGHMIPPNMPQGRSRRASSSRVHEPPPLPLRLRPIVLLLIFLPIPPLLSLIYMLTGHAILRSTDRSHHSIFRTPLLASIEAGATGGIILSLPFALLLYILLFPNKPPSAPEDFFEDDNSSITGTDRWMRYAGYIVGAFLVLGIGGMAGPLGVTCLSSGTSGEFAAARRMLTTGAATSAGFLGGVVVSFATLAFCMLALVIWSIWVRRNQPTPL
ncbi:hypothetical protein B0H34DRAFT_110986 [Crassisporium funariophilum]|nr:hypothetical protein B0H34DRAFT_110986 [Crassisporium funariophilum]